MSVMIKGMKMPKNCHSCPMCLMRFCQAGDRELSEQETRPNAKRPEDCPLVPVPEPHGRLGDLDKLEKMFADIDSAPYSCFDGAEPFYSAEDAVHIIRLAPTIIPATAAKEGE